MCDTIGKIFPNGTALFGKNSDRSPNEPQVIEFYPAQIHSENKLKATYIEVNQVKETKAILLSRPTWLWGGEMGVNECGVCIGNEAVFTKGKYGKTGLTGMDMLRLALERSETAKMALDCLIDVLEQYGQGGNCGFDHEFYYDNGFLITDGKEQYILETAGKHWVYKKTDCAAISNRLSIGSDGDVYSDTPCDFKKKYTEPVYSYFSQAANRRKLCSTAIEKTTKLEDVFSALRQHADESDPLCKASVSSPCMHYGGLVGDHTTQSLAVEWDKEGKMNLWATGSSLPCISIFKPISFGKEPFAPTYWNEIEAFHRSLLGCKLPAEYYIERDEIEAELIKQSRTLDPQGLSELCKYALKKEQEFIDKWKNISLDKGTTSSLFRKNWAKKNSEYEK